MKKTLLLICMLWLPAAAAAQTQTFVLGGGQIQMSSDQKLMFAGMKQVMNRDFRGAENSYSQAIAINGSNMDAYLQRGVVRRELGNSQGAASDGRAVVILANNKLAAAPQDAKLYYKRGMGYRLMQQYEQAKLDVTKALRLGGQTSWQTDLKAIEFESKQMK